MDAELVRALEKFGHYSAAGEIRRRRTKPKRESTVTPVYSPSERTNRKARSSLEEYRDVEHAVGRTKGVTPASQSAAFWAYMVSKAPGGDSRYVLDPAEERALSRATGAGGGFLVPADFEVQIVSAARAESPIPALAREINTETGATIPLPTNPAHGSAAWIAESAAVTASDETLGQVGLGAFKTSSKTVTSEELAQDSGVPFDEWLSGELGAALGAVQGEAYATGSGAGQPQGYVANVTAVTAATGSATAFKLADLTALYKALPVQYRTRASWVFNGDDFGSLASLVDSSGGLVLPSLQGERPSLFSRPVYIDPYLPAPAANAKSAAFGDFKTGYAVRRVRGVGVQRLTELHSDQGQIGFRAHERVDGRVVIGDAIRALSHSAT